MFALQHGDSMSIATSQTGVTKVWEGDRVELGYLVHDLADPAVARRISTFLAGGAKVATAGFRRGEKPIGMIAGQPVLDIGHTTNGRLIARIGSVLKALFTLPAWAGRLAGCDIIVARNLEMLLLGAALRLVSKNRPPLVYEMLDVHSLMVRDNAPAKLLRGLEGALLRQTSQIIVSSPAFVSEYLDRHHPGHPPALLVENKVFDVAPGAAARSGSGIVAEPPWRIGWFGNLRCRRSLDCLVAVARKFPTLVAVDIRGKLSSEGVKDLPEIVAGLDNVTFHGAYNAAQLQDIYDKVHFTWAIDYYEAGFNSNWLLPNRLYEGCGHGSVPIALGSVETGRWMAARSVGLLIEEPLEEALARLLTEMDAATFEMHKRQVLGLDRDDLRWSQQGCATLVGQLGALSPQMG